jgi:hypothetical protein
MIRSRGYSGHYDIEKDGLYLPYECDTPKRCRLTPPTLLTVRNYPRRFILFKLPWTPP